jgi:chromate reductase
MFQTSSPQPMSDPGHGTASGSPLRVVALVGSLRRASLNRALLDAARDLAPPGLAIEPAEIGDLPFFDADLEARGDPLAVRRLKAAIAEADAVVVVTPEYNHSLPAVLKNAIDWASRPAPVSPLAGKPVLIMGASSGRSGAKHALAHAADVLAHTRMIPFERRLGVPLAGDLLDADGRLADATARAELAALLADFARAVRDGRSVMAAA